MILKVFGVIAPPPLPVPPSGLRECEYVYQTSSYILWPAAARKLLTLLPVDGPADVYLSRLLLERKLRARMCRPRLVCQALVVFGLLDLWSMGLRQP